MKVVLKDGAPRSTRTVEINVSKNGNTLEIGAAGVEPAPVVLEFYDGKLNLRLYSDLGVFIDSKQLDITPNVATVVAATSSPSADVVAVLPAAVAVEADSGFDEAAFDAA